MNSQQSKTKDDQQTDCPKPDENQDIAINELNSSVSNLENQQTKQSKMVEKQESFDFYLDLKYVDSSKQNQAEHIMTKKSLNLKIDPLVYVEDDSQFPLLHLQQSPRSHKPLEIKIVSYKTSTFLGLSTQIFTVRVCNRNIEPPKEYEIERRFSDFVDLYQQQFHNHPGYILYPFPDKTLETFIKIKLGISIEPNQKLELVQKRLSQLEAFLNYISHHKYLCTSEELEIFLSENEKVFEQGKTRLNKFVEECRILLVKSQLNNIVGIGKSVLNSYFNNGNSPITNQYTVNSLAYGNKTMAEALLYVKQQKEKIIKKLSQVQLLIDAQKQFSKFIDMSSDNDILMKFVAKHNSNRDFSNKLAIYLEFAYEKELSLVQRKLEEVEKNLLHHQNIIEEIINAKNTLDLQKKAKLERMLERVEKNFQFDWQPFLQNHRSTVQALDGSLSQKWKQYKSDARKIWRAH